MGIMKVRTPKHLQVIYRDRGPTPLRVQCKYVQGGPSGREYNFADIKLKAPLQYELLILERIVRKSLSATRWATL